MTGGESERSIDEAEAENTGTSAETNSATGTTRTGGHGSDDDGSGGDDGDRGTVDPPSLAASVRDATERGDGEEEVVERVRAGYDREIPYRRVKRLVKAERERLQEADIDLHVEGHAPRYVAIDDLDYLTDTEFGRVVAHLVGGRDGHSEIVPDTDPTAPSDDGTHAGDTAGAAVDENRRDDEPVAGSESVAGTRIRWHRADGTVLTQAIAAEPGRVVDGDLVRRVHETNGGTGHDDGSENRKSRERDPAGAAIVTVADVVPGAARLAVRSGVAIHDRAAVRQWLDEARLTTETFGSLIEGA